RPETLVAAAEAAGFPRTVCAWIKGIYGVAIGPGGPERIVVVTQGDCSNARALAEVLNRRGKTVIPFEYPADKDRGRLGAAIDRLIELFGATRDGAASCKSRLDRIRRKLVDLDDLAWREDRVRGAELHQWLVKSSDFDGDPDAYEAELDGFLREVRARPRLGPAVRLGFLGVPPIMTDFFDVVEGLGGRVIYDEIARQFAMPYQTEDLVDQYLAFTYPYDVSARVADIAAEVEQRGLAGLIHYTQSFCHRQIEDIVLRAELAGVPVLTLEGDRVGPTDGRTRLRLESFLEMLDRSGWS
ncbi:MAG: 2-hydroxyacyl-CoA dehydratase, partial [Proteobacteria bacterium]|nr:2-hydroxyacyl-CoA dehydratase [Pseudomonadota bacterium]MBU1742689.1 2-hydroxyacyl-CoA dehydratase [Pseudomonadota bacterium]